MNANDTSKRAEDAEQEFFAAVSQLLTEHSKRLDDAHQFTASLLKSHEAQSELVQALHADCEEKILSLSERIVILEKAAAESFRSNKS